MGEALAAYADDPVRFVEEVLGDAGRPYSKQREMLALLAERRRVSVVGCNGSGKDWAAARAVLWWLAARPRAKAVVTGPTQRQIEEIVWREMRAAYDAASVPLGGRISAAKWTLDDDRFAIGFSTNRPDNLQGFHSPDLLVVVTEAHAVPQSHMEAVKRLNPARTLLTGNPFSRAGEFFDSHHTKRHLYHRIAISAFDTPNFTGENGGMPGMPTPEDIEERRLDWGEDHPLYQGSILGRFPDQLDDSLLGRDAVEQAVTRWESEPRLPDADPLCMGVDVARFGYDKTALCVRRGWRVEGLRTFERADTMRTTGEVLTWAREVGSPSVYVDEGGVGGGVVDRLREVGMPVRGVQFGGKALHAARFLNLRAEIFWELRRLFNDGLIAIPRDEELISQLLALRYDVTSAGQVKLESKADLRKRGMRSLDKADALALAFMAPPSLRIWTG